MASRRNIPYSRLAVDDDDDYNQVRNDPRFNYSPKTFDKVPWKSILLALFLLGLGCLLLVVSFFIFTGHMEGDSSQSYGFLGLGLLTFVPGTVMTLIAIIASMKLESLTIPGEVLKDTALLQFQIIEVPAVSAHPEHWFLVTFFFVVCGFIVFPL